MRLEAIAIRLEAIATRLRAIAIRLEAIAIRLEAIANNRYVGIGVANGTKFPAVEATGKNTGAKRKLVARLSNQRFSAKVLPLSVSVNQKFDSLEQLPTN